MSPDSAAADGASVSSTTETAATRSSLTTSEVAATDGNNSKEAAAVAAKNSNDDVVKGIMAVANFREESLGDQVKLFICLLIVLYLVINYVRWQSLNSKFNQLQSQLHNLEKVAAQLLAQQSLNV